jgi:hypothetical protein
MLSKKVKAKHFAIVPGGVETTNRRFAMIGVPLVAWLFIKFYSVIGTATS